MHREMLAESIEHCGRPRRKNCRRSRRKEVRKKHHNEVDCCEVRTSAVFTRTSALRRLRGAEVEFRVGEHNSAFLNRREAEESSLRESRERTAEGWRKLSQLSTKLARKKQNTSARSRVKAQAMLSEAEVKMLSLVVTGGNKLSNSYSSLISPHPKKNEFEMRRRRSGKSCDQVNVVRQEPSLGEIEERRQLK